MPKASFRFNRERAREVLLPLYESYVERTHAFSVLHAENSAPQNVFVPEGMKRGSEAHVQYLFFVSLITLRSKSSVGFEKAVTLYSRFPDLFTSLVCNKTPEDIIVAFRESGVPHQRSWAPYWIDCGRALFLHFHGDPLLLISEAGRKGRGGNVVKGFVAIKQELKQRKEPCFSGMGEKLFSLFCIFCEELGFTRGVADTMPADVWLQNILLSTGAVGGGNRSLRIDTTRLAQFLRIALTRFAREEGVSLASLANVMWLHGSEVCQRCHTLRNLSSVCPVHEYCQGRLDAWAYWHQGKWKMDMPRAPKGHPSTQGVLFPSENIDFCEQRTLLGRKEKKVPQQRHSNAEEETAPKQLTFLDGD